MPNVPIPTDADLEIASNILKNTAYYGVQQQGHRIHFNLAQNAIAQALANARAKGEATGAERMRSVCLGICTPETWDDAARVGEIEDAIRALPTERTALESVFLEQVCKDLCAIRETLQLVEGEFDRPGWRGTALRELDALLKKLNEHISSVEKNGAGE